MLTDLLQRRSRFDAGSMFNGEFEEIYFFRLLKMPVTFPDEITSSITVILLRRLKQELHTR